MNENSIANQTESEDEFEAKLQRSAAGRRANSRGKLSGALLARASGAERVARYDNNLCRIDGVSVRFHSVSGKQTNFSINPLTEPAGLIAAFGAGAQEPDKPPRYLLYGIRLADCIRAGRPEKSKTAPRRLRVSVSQVSRLRLGEAYLPVKYTEAETVADLMDRMDAIEALTPEALESVMDVETKAKVQAFILDGHEPPNQANAQACTDD